MIKCRRLFRPGLLALVLFAMMTGVSTASASLINLYVEVRAFEGHEELLDVTGWVWEGYAESEAWFDPERMGDFNLADPGSNLESGVISEGTHIIYNHQFDQAALEVEEVVDAFFLVAFSEEGTEEQSITNVRFGLIRWQEGESVWANEGLLAGDLELGALDTTMEVKVAANRGDVNLWGSALAVAYTGGPSAAIPEPSSALLFSFGAGIVAFSLRRRSE